MRQYTTYALNDRTVIKNLNILANKSTLPKDYSNAFFVLGQKLSLQINQRISQKSKVVIACSTEDADWLAKGILEKLDIREKKLVVFWNLRTNPFKNDAITIAPIIKTYKEDISQCDTLIVCKSIIYTSCVVRTNLTFLIEEINPAKIIISAPVLFEYAEVALKTEFDESISSKFEFIYFAKDNIASNGEVVPGIGGDVYIRLGLGDLTSKSKYIPEIVKSRRNSP